MNNFFKQFCRIVMTLIVTLLGNVTYSCDGESLDSQAVVVNKLVQFKLNNINLHQMHCLSINSLIGINTGAEVVILPAHEWSNTLTSKINAKGKVISLYLLEDGILLALLVPFQQQSSLQLLKISLRNNDILAEITIALDENMPIFDGLQTKIITNAINLGFNFQYLDAQIIPFDHGYTALIFRKNIIPTVIWLRGNHVFAEHSLLPIPINDFDAQLQMNMGSFRAWKNEDSLMIVMDNHRSYVLPLTSYFQKNYESFGSYSHIIFKSMPLSFSLMEGKNLGANSKFMDNGHGNIFSASVEGNEIVIRSNINENEFRIVAPALHSKTNIRNFYVNESEIWLVGETGIKQTHTGSIISGSEAFFANILLENNLLRIKKWHRFHTRRNYISNIFVSKEHIYVVLVENASLTHDSNDTSFLSLLSIENLSSSQRYGF